MKKLLLSTTFLLSAACIFAGPTHSSALLKQLQAALSQNTETVWTSKGKFDQTEMLFNGKTVKVFRDQVGLIAFSIHYQQSDLPSEIADAMAKKCPGIPLYSAAHFVYSDGREADYASIKSKKTEVAYEIKNGKASYFGCAR